MKIHLTLKPSNPMGEGPVFVYNNVKSFTVVPGFIQLTNMQDGLIALFAVESILSIVNPDGDTSLVVPALVI